MVSSQPAAAQQTFEDLLRAAKDGDLQTVQNLVARGMDPDTSDPAGNTLLMIAAREGQMDVANYLAGQKARIRARNGAGETAIMFASLKGHLEVVKMLHASGAEVSGPGWAPLHYCAWGGHTEICRFLLDRGAAVDALSPNRTSALMIAARQGDAEMVGLLLARSANPTIRNDSDASALSWALRAGHTAIAEQLRRAGAQ